MILSDRDIRKAIKEKRVSIDPFDQADIQPSSVDLHVDRLFRTFHNHRYAHIDVKKPMEELTEMVEVQDGEAFILHPGEFVLGSTSEYVKLPDDLVARLEGKSSLGRLGLLIHSSLPAEEEILFLHDGQLMLRPIGEIVGKQLEGSVVGFDPDTFEVGYHQVTGWFEGAPDRIFEVTLATGRKVKLTGGHDLFTLDASGDTVKVPIRSVPPGTKVAIPNQIPDIPSEHPVVLNLAELAPEDSHASLVCSGPSVTNAWDNDPDLPNALRAIGIVQHVSYYRKRQQLPFSVAKMLGIDKQLSAKDFLSIKQGAHRFPVLVDVDKEIAWLLGIYVAEGYVRKNQVTITNYDPAILDRVQAAFAQIGLPSYRTAHYVTCCSSVMAYLIHWLGMSGKARQKRLPNTVLTWPRLLLESFLEGFVDGDGSREETRVSLWTGSERLAGDLMLLCQRLGLRASASHRLREDGPLWQVSVPFREHKLLMAVPLVNELLIDVRRESGMDQKTAAEAAGFGYPTQLNNIERGRWPAVRKRTLTSLRDAFAGRGTTSPRLDRIVDGDLCWDEVVEVRDTGRIEPVFDLEVRPEGRKVESFVAGYGGIFVSNTAGYVDPGFEGHLTLELSNVANLPITIYPGMKIGQISFFKLTSPAENPYGSGKLGSKYQGQRGPTASRYYENF